MDTDDNKAAYDQGFSMACEKVLVKIRQCLALPGVLADTDGPADTVLKMLGNEVSAMKPRVGEGS